MFVFFNKFAVWFCESRLGAPRFKELRAGSVGRHQVSFWIMCVYYSGPVGIIGYTVANQSTNKDTRQAYISASSTVSAQTHGQCPTSRDRCLLLMINHHPLQDDTETKYITRNSVPQ